MNNDGYSLVYHFNPHTGLWYCFDRVDYVSYWSDKKNIKCLGQGSTVDEAKTNYENQLSINLSYGKG